MDWRLQGLLVWTFGERCGSLPGKVFAPLEGLLIVLLLQFLTLAVSYFGPVQPISGAQFLACSPSSENSLNPLPYFCFSQKFLGMRSVSGYF